MHINITKDIYYKMNKEIPLITTQIINLLKSNGHTCALYNMQNKTLEWCNQDKCKNTEVYLNMEIRQKQQEELVKKLEKQGHKCIRIMESYPMQVGWCNKTPCEKSSK